MPMINHLLIIIALLCCFNLADALQKKSADKSACTLKFLKLKDCMISRGPYKLQFTKQKILVNNGVWRGVHKQPIVTKGSSWRSVAIKRLENRYLLEQLVWDAPSGEADIQSLHWYVWELNKEEIVERIHEVVQKRQASSASSGKSYINDPAQKYGVKRGKRGKILWRSNGKRGEF